MKPEDRFIIALNAKDLPTMKEIVSVVDLAKSTFDGLPLIKAVDMKFEEGIKLIATKGKMDRRDKAGFSYALNYAVENKKYDLAQTLLARGAHPHKEDVYEYQKEKCNSWGDTIHKHKWNMKGCTFAALNNHDHKMLALLFYFGADLKIALKYFKAFEFQYPNNRMNRDNETLSKTLSQAIALYHLQVTTIIFAQGLLQKSSALAVLGEHVACEILNYLYPTRNTTQHLTNALTTLKHMHYPDEKLNTKSRFGFFKNLLQMNHSTTIKPKSETSKLTNKGSTT